MYIRKQRNGTYTVFKGRHQKGVKGDKLQTDLPTRGAADRFVTRIIKNGYRED